MIELRPLPKNGRIAITSPATKPDANKLNQGISYLENREFDVVVGDTCYAEEHYLAGSDAMRADELMRFFEDDSIDAVFCSRGGFGSMRILSMLDFYLFREKPKLLVGFSDITALQWALYTEAGLPSVSGMMPAVDFCDSSEESKQAEEQFWRLVIDGKLDLEIPHQQEEEQVIEAPFLAGTLSVATKLMGSHYFPNIQDHLMLLEDVGEQKHKLEGYLYKMEMAGVFQQLKGLLLGNFTPSEHEEYPILPTEDEVIHRSVKTLRGPLIKNLPYGHIPNKISVPTGIPLTLSLGAKSRLSLETSLFDS
jgi:muramoyltetrapeptide carboxypeptidase